MSDFLREGRVDDLFLTVAPQIAGRQDGDERPAFVAGARFAPRHPLWSRLVDARRGTRCLFLRYGDFGSAPRPRRGVGG
jgi:riboflavin biosynthesis pyrimidine reductase